MENIDPITYYELRRGGASVARACAELDVTFGRIRRLEARLSPCGGEGRPRFARHAAHVRAVLAAGGYPGLKP